MPLSYQGFGFTSILLMITILIAGQLFRYVKERIRRNDHQKE
jgi:hypothetical protein